MSEHGMSFPSVHTQQLEPELSAARGTYRTILAESLGLRRTRVGLVLLGFILGLCILGPLLAPFPATEIVGVPASGPSDGHRLGTDFLGRDVLSRTLVGGRSLLAIATCATILGVGLGVITGLITAFWRKWYVDGFAGFLDIFLAFPQLILVLLFLTLLGNNPILLLVLVALGCWTRTSRVVRSAALGVVNRDFVKATVAMGLAKRKILAGEVLPNILGPVLVELALRLTFCIAIITSMSFLGFGAEPPAADWGLMISENRTIIVIQPWPVVVPVLLIAILTISTNLIGDGLAKAAGSMDSA